MTLALAIVLDGRFRSLEELEREIIAMAMEVCDGNRTKAAALLGIGRSTLHRKLKSEPAAPIPTKPHPKASDRLDGPMNLQGVVTRGGPAWIKGKGPRR